MPKFALLAALDDSRTAAIEPDVMSEGFSVLLSLGHSEKEARRLVDAALEKKQNFKDVQSLLQAVYEQGRGSDSAAP